MSPRSYSAFENCCCSRIPALLRMSPDPATWIKDFLGKRGLERPDGRVLYAYRCTAEEFDSLTELLRCMSFDIAAAPRHDVNVQVRAFVLYAAEWWQRRYDGGPWSWEPLLESIQCRHVYYHDLYEPVRSALRWWEVDIVRLPTSVRYLGTFACQGGLPLGLVGDADSKVAYYLRAVLNHAIEYRQCVNDSIDLAHLLHPPTLRRDYVFRLADDLIEAVLDLRDDAQGKDPITTLDRVRPGWRDTMPLSLENERARNLLTSLLREAVQDRPPAGDFRVERFLRKTSVGWRLGAQIRLPVSISAERLARHLEISKDDLPPRMAVRVYGDRVHDVGLYAAESDNFVLMDLKKQYRTELWDAEAAAEIRLQFVSGGVVGEGVYPYRGAALGELPWAFRGDASECPFIGEGSVSNRAPEIFVLAPDGCTTVFKEFSGVESERPDPSTEANIRVLNRILWRIAERTVIETIHGRCLVRPSSGQMAAEDYRLEGRRCYDLEFGQPLFRGVPKLRVARTGKVPRAVPSNEVTWRQTGKEWQQFPDTYGLWRVRYMSGGEIRYLGSVGILPERFRLTLKPDSGMEGDLVLSGAEAVKVSGQQEEIRLETQIKGDQVRIRVIAENTSAPPSKICFKLHWRDRAQLHVKAPFPGYGGHFSRDGKSLDQKFTIDDLYGVRAIALSPKDTQQFWLYGELKTSDLGNSLFRIANFQFPLRKSGLVYELPLFEARSIIEQLLAASSSGEATIVLRIMSPDRAIPKPNQSEYAEVKRFEGILEYDANKASISISPALDDNGEAHVSFELLSLASPDAHPVSMDSTIGMVEIPQNLDLKEPWMIVVRHGDKMRVQPIVIGGRSTDFVGNNDAEAPCLREAMSLDDPDLRKRAIARAMDAMLNSEETNQDEEEWSFLTDSLLCAESLPATELDLLKVLVSKPNLLVRCVFQLESAPRQLLWKLEDKLPFSWFLIKREIWWTEAKQVFERLHSQLTDMANDDQAVRIACEHVRSILTEGTRQIQELHTVKCDIDFRLMGHQIPDSIMEKSQKNRNDKTQEQLRLRFSLNDWPKGNGRSEWADELEQGELLNKLAVWQQEGESRERQPIFDTPVAAAWCCFKSKATERTTFLVKRIRAHDPEWFDLAYEAAWFQFAIMQDKGEL